MGYLLAVLLDPYEFGSSPGHPWTCWYPNNMDNTLLNWKQQCFNSAMCTQYAFQSFDFYLSIAQSVIFSQIGCHQMIYDNWHTAICMNC